MPLPDNFPEKDLLEGEGYETVKDVSEATDEELLAISRIGDAKLASIREVAPYEESSDATGPGATSQKGSGPDGSLEPTAESYVAQTSKSSKDQTDPATGQPLPKGIVKNQRGTLTASSTVEQDDMVSPERVKREHAAMLRRAGEKLTALMTEG